jgi:hypothetical protein
LQKEAHESEVKAYKTLIGLIIIGVLLIIFFIAAFLLWKSSQRKIERLKRRYADATDEYEENLHELQLLESTHKQVIAAIQQELSDTQSESSGFREKYAESQHTIFQINQDYESEKSRLTEENIILRKQIVELQKNDVISKYKSISESFAKETIVIRIREIANSPLTKVSDNEWKALTKAFANSYPTLFHDVSKQFDTPQYVWVCILTALGIGSKDQANMMGVESQRISNIKSALNKILFNEATSRTLHKNIVAQYNVYSIPNENVSE